MWGSDDGPARKPARWSSFPRVTTNRAQITIAIRTTESTNRDRTNCLLFSPVVVRRMSAASFP
jgi:hypothetical protein